MNIIKFRLIKFVNNFKYYNEKYNFKNLFYRKNIILKYMILIFKFEISFVK
jgi:hypothetical protein